MRFDIRTAKESFFDRQTVTSAADRASLRVLSKFGSFVRRTAKTLLRRKGTRTNPASRPGEPPRQHTGLLRDHVYFGYEPDRKSVVIGPAKLAGTAGPDIPATLEYGGTARTGLLEVAVYEPRPFMGPAYQKEAPKLPDMWKNSIRK